MSQRQQLQKKCHHNHHLRVKVLLENVFSSLSAFMDKLMEFTKSR